MGGYYTPVAGTTISASTHDTYVRDQVVSQFASTAARDSAITSPVHGMVAAITGGDYLTYYNGAVWVCITPQSAVVQTSENTTSTSYTNLSTSGPAVTLVTGTSAQVSLYGHIATNTTVQSYIGVVVSGATTLAAADNYSITCPASGSGIGVGGTFVITGLTAGSNTFTAKYKVASAATGTFLRRQITVVGLP